MDWLNTNTIHNTINVLIAVIGLAAPLLVAAGCIHDPVLDKFDCSKSIIPPLWIGPILGGLGVLKLVINLGRDGLTGLVKQQPPVASATTTVVVANPETKAKPEVIIKAPQKKSNR